MSPQQGEVDGCGTGVLVLLLAGAALVAALIAPAPIAAQGPGQPACPTPTALTLTSFSASGAGNRGGCAEGNKIRGLACTVTAYTPGFVSGTCDGGYWFSKVRTARTFRDQQPVTAQGCIGLNLRLAGAPGWPLRIGR